MQADYYTLVRWQGVEFNFVVEAKLGNTPRVVDDALRQARRWASQTGKLPMVIVPYLGERRIDRLEQELVSGLDLCGNGIIIVPGKMILRATGKPNRFPESRSEESAYRGKTSLVPRAFFRRPIFTSVNQVKAEIEEAGAEISLPTVSRALVTLANDLMIDRSNDRIALIQPESLLDRLRENYSQPKVEQVFKAKFTASRIPELFWPQNRNPEIQLALSGASSIEKYSAGLRADPPVFYTNSLSKLREAYGKYLLPTDRFFDITFIETRDPSPFFDIRPDNEGMPYAPPLDTYLELAAGKERRDIALAADVREKVLKDIPWPAGE